jgi:hypothetical protein
MTTEKVPLRTEQAHVGLTNKYSNYLLPAYFDGSGLLCGFVR